MEAIDFNCSPPNHFRWKMVRANEQRNIYEDFCYWQLCLKSLAFLTSFIFVREEPFFQMLKQKVKQFTIGPKLI